MTVTKAQQLACRREKVMELYSRGLTQMEIVSEFSKKMGITISQKTISNDLAWLKKDAIDFVVNSRQNLAFEYKQIESNLKELHKAAWQHYESTNDERAKIELYDTIQNINMNIHTLRQ
jgi:hypothetical protein